MKIAILSGASSIHTIQWANRLSKSGIEVYLITQHQPLEPLLPEVKVYVLPYRGVIGYYTMVPTVRKILREIKPDLLNAHYASGYATTARLVEYHPWILSVWGSDVFSFPYKSWLHKRLVQKNLLAADKIGSTSIAMAKQTKSLIPNKYKDIRITPFGVDCNYYDSLTTPLSSKVNSNNIVIGTVKKLAPVYGIDTLINAFSLLYKNLSKTHPDISKKLSLRIVGYGPQEEYLKQLTKNLNIEKLVTFVGRVNNPQVPLELDKLDIYVALSRLESFGVAIIEASAAGRPVVVSNAGGLPEVVVDKETGIIVPINKPKIAADAIEKLVLNEQMRVRMGESGKIHVSRNFDWSRCLDIMIDLYKETISDYERQKSK